MAETQIEMLPPQYDPERKFRVHRASFFDAQQDSYTTPPAQQSDYFERLWNVMPPSVQGNLQRRWGYQLWSADATVIRHLYEFQQQSGLVRRIIGTAGDGSGANNTTNKVVVYNEDGTVFLTPLFNPSTSASSPRMVASRDYAYFADGIQADLQKWNGLAGGLTKWGIAAPTIAPSVAATSSTNQAWTTSTTYTTFGILVDSGSNIQQLTSVNADGTNPGAQIGLTGAGQPAWSNTTGSTLVDNTVHWQNRGPVGLWQPNTTYNNFTLTNGTVANPAVIYDPGTNCLYGNSAVASTGVSGTTRPNFTGINGQQVHDNWGSGVGIPWFCIGPAPSTWLPSHTYVTIGSVSFDDRNASIVQPTTCAASYNTTTGTFSQTVYWHVATTGGTSAATGSHPGWGLTAGAFTDDRQVRWECMGSATWAANFAYKPWSGNGVTFGAVKDSNGNIQICVANSGLSGNTQPSPWSTQYGATTPDAGVTWVCVGSSLSWTASTKWFLPSAGFSPPTSTVSYTGSSIKGTSNTSLEAVVNSGISGAGAEPTWAATGVKTTDNTITWFNVEPAPTTAGSITLLSGRTYYMLFNNTSSGGMSDISPISLSTGPITASQVFLSNLQVSGDPQVDSKTIIATADGNNTQTLYFVGTIPNASTTFTDTVAETTLLANNVYVFVDAGGNIFGALENGVPPNGQYPTKHRGRIYMLSGQNLVFSKSLAEITTPTGLIAGRYEEAFPVENTFDISTGAEIGRALLSDGDFLYIGTDRHVLRVIGDGPANFEPPQTAFNEGGVLNQECWRSVFIDGSPLGVMWITPDYRVYLSDFNTHHDVGIPIQDVLNTINPVANANVYAQYYALGAFNFYVLAIPTGSHTDPDTLCIFDLKSRKWFIWFPTDQVTSLVYNINASGIPQIIFWSSAAVASRGYKFVPGLTQDRVNNTPVNFTCTARTSWMDFGDGSLRKILNQMWINSNDSANVLCTIEGATNASDFATPNTVISNGTFKSSPFGNPVMYLAGKTSRDKYYRLTFTSPSQFGTFLRSYTIKGFGFNRF